MPLQSPVESTEHTPDALGTAAEQALREHAAESKRLAPGVAEKMTKLGAWAWQGEGDAGGLKALVLDVATSLFRSPADAHYGRPVIADPDASSWLEDLLAVVGNDTPLGQTVMAAAIRLEIQAGKSILPSTLATLFRVDAARIRTMIQKGGLEDANASSPAAGKSGHRPKGLEARVTAASAFRWLVDQGRVPEGAAPPTATKKRGR